MKKLNRIFIYLLGIILIALGAVLAIKSNLGASPISSLPLAISKVMPLELGSAAALLFIIYVAIQIVLLKREFKIIQLLQIVFAILFGKLMDLFNIAININVDSIILRITFCMASFFITAVGVMLTITANIVPVAPDGLTQVIAKKAKIDFGKAKLYFDGTVVILSIAILLICGKNLKGLGIGTILSALCVGRIVTLINKIFKEKVEGFIFSEDEVVEEVA